MTTSDWLSRILPHLKDARGPDARGEYIAWCPFHNDGQGKPPHQPNLYVSERGWFCHVCQKGGGLRELARELGIVSERSNGGDGQRQIDKTYDYRDESSTLLFQVVRFDPKGFKQRRPDGKSGLVPFSLTLC